MTGLLIARSRDIPTIIMPSRVALSTFFNTLFNIMGRKQQGVKLPEIPWAQDDHKLVWDFITQIEKDVNYKILFGKKDPSEVSHYIRGAALSLKC